MKRVFVYVDGFNLYYRALSKTLFKWLNLQALCENLLDEDNIIVAIKYYTARVSGRTDRDEPKRQQAYLNALKTIPLLSIYYGRFLVKTKWRPLVNTNPMEYAEIYDTEEKGSDVNLAAHLIHDGWMNRYDVALVLSQDSDLIEPLRIVNQDLKKIIGLVWLDGKQPNKKLTKVVSFTRHLTRQRLAVAQFPETLMGKNGHLILKPEKWK